MNFEKKRASKTNFLPLRNWKNETNSVAIQGHMNKFTFLKGERRTIPSQIIKNAKRTSSPSPGDYDIKDMTNIPKLPLQTSPKCMNIVEAANKARQTPGFIYHPETAEKLTRPTATVPKMGTIPLKEKITNADKYKVKKSLNPDMGSYDAMDSFKKT